MFFLGDDAVVLKAGRNQDAWRLNTPTQDIVVRNCEVVKGHTLLGIGSEMSGGVRRVFMHDCHVSSDVFRLFYLKTNHRRGGFIEDIHMQDVSCKSSKSVFEIDTDVLYQWRDIVPTFADSITRIRNISLKNAKCQESQVIYQILGDERNPIQGIHLENIHVEKVTKFLNNAEFVRDLTTKNITWGKAPERKD